MPDEISSRDVTGVDDDKLYAVLAYLTVLVVVPLLLKRNDPFVAWHARQGLVVLLGLILSLVIAAWIPRLGNFLFLVLLAANVIALVQVLLGRRWKIPLLGTIATRFRI
ncbi:MAG: hypothetical protein WEA04_01350 [Candidatus Andersenbacteria bacterium]